MLIFTMSLSFPRSGGLLLPPEPPSATAKWAGRPPIVAGFLKPGDQLLDVVRPPELDLDRHLDVAEAGVQHALTAVLDADDVDAHLRDGARKALQLAGAVPEAGAEGEVPPGRRHAETDHPEQQQR